MLPTPHVARVAAPLLLEPVVDPAKAVVLDATLIGVNEWDFSPTKAICFVCTSKVKKGCFRLNYRLKLGTS